MPRAMGVAVVFVAAGAVLVLEILAVRLAAPYVGLTLETYSAAIGIALTGIAAGAALGGGLADQLDPRRTLGPTLLIGGGLVVAVGPLFDALGPHAGTGPRGAVTLVAAGTLPAITVLSMAHPAVVKLLLASLERTGSTVGALSAVGTGGALAGTFLTGFVLLGSYSTKTILIATGLVVVAFGVVVTLVVGRSRGTALAAVVLVPLFAVGLTSDRPCDRETAYYCARIASAPGEPALRTLYLDDLRHAEVDVGHPGTLFFPYTLRFKDIADLSFPHGRALRALHIGGGGFSLPRYLAASRPGTKSVVLELDPDLVKLDRDKLGLRTGPGLQVRIGDARVSIRDQASGAYDLVLGDAFASRSVPWHLTTKEFLGDVRRVMRPRGVYALNLIDGPKMEFVKAELATLRSVFPHVVLLRSADRLGPSAYGNFVVAASRRRLPRAALRERARRLDFEVVGEPGVAALAKGARVLTDDYAPVDQLLTQHA